MSHKWLTGILLLLLANPAWSQRPFHYQKPFKRAFFINDTLPNPARKKLVVGGTSAAYGVSALYLGVAWYADQGLGPFKFFDDSFEWKQMDKVGHVYGGYHASRWVIGMMKWAGVPKKKALIAGGVSGFLAMSTIEVMDGFGVGWGFSWSDMGANALGTGLAVANQALWNEDRLSLKVTYRQSPYAQVDSLQRLLGSNPLEWFVKDYNGQVMWLSCRVHSFLPDSWLKDHYPRWLNLAVGYGAEGLIGGYDDPVQTWRDREYRQFYLSLDLDLPNIRTKNGFLNSVFEITTLFRVPMPAVEFDRNGVRMVGFR